MKKCAFLWVVVLWSCGGAGQPQDPEQAAMVEAHNAIRAAVTPAPSSPLPALKWSAALAATAQAYANKCIWKHSGQSGVGENLFAGTSTYTPKRVVQAWADEVANYNYDSASCTQGKVCGHYTQIVWRDTLEVGCGKARCPGILNGREGEFWVCQYSPPGNYRGQKPY